MSALLIGATSEITAKLPAVLLFAVYGLTDLPLAQPGKSPQPNIISRRGDCSNCRRGNPVTIAVQAILRTFLGMFMGSFPAVPLVSAQGTRL